MQRRTLLATGSLLALAGCVGAGPPSGDGDDGGGTDGSGGSAGDGGSGGSPTPTPPPTPTGPRVVSEQFDRREDCEQSGAARVEFPDDVVVTGCIRGRNACREAALAGTSYDADADVLRIEVAAVDDTPPGTACAEVIVSRGYRVRVGFDEGLPGTVVVVHRNYEGTTEVARVERGST